MLGRLDIARALGHFNVRRFYYVRGRCPTVEPHAFFVARYELFPLHIKNDRTQRMFIDVDAYFGVLLNRRGYIEYFLFFFYRTR